MKKIVTYFLFFLATCAVAQNQSGNYKGFDWTISDGVLSITGEGKIPNVYFNEEPYWYKNNNGDVIKSLRLSDGITEIGTSLFSNLKNLTNVELPGTLKSIERSVFYNCPKIEVIKIPDSVEKIGDAAFSGCTSITEFYLGKELKNIGRDAFAGCTSLRKVVMGQNVEQLGYTLFYECSNLKSLFIYSKRPPKAYSRTYVYENSAYLSTFQTVAESCTLYVPDGSENSYYVAEGWKDFQTIKTFDASSEEAEDPIDVVNRLKIEYEQLSEENKKLITEINNLKKELTNLKEDYEIVKELKEVLKTTNESLTELNKELTDRNKELTDRNTELTDRNKELNEENANLHKENNFFDEELAFYRLGDLNKDGRTDIDDVVMLLAMDNYSSNTDEFALLTEQTSISLLQIDELYGNVEFYKLDGTKVANPTENGIYILKKNGQTKMIILKR